MKSKIQIQLLVIYLVTLAVVVGGFQIYISRNIYSRMQRDVIKNMEFTTASLEAQLETYFSNSDQVMINMIYKGTLLKYLEELNEVSGLTDMERMKYARKFDELIENQSTFPIIPSSHVSIYNLDRTYKYEYNPVKTSNLGDVLENSEKEEYLEHYNRVICRSENSENGTFSIIRLITNLDAEKLGYMELQLDYRDLDRMCDFKDERTTYILNQNENMLYPDKTVEKAELDFADEITGEKTGVVQIGNDYYAWEKLDKYDMIVAIRQSEQTMFETLNSLKRTTMTILVLLFLGASFVGYYSVYRTLKPIKTLTEQVMKINYGQMNLDIHKEQHIADEMVVLQSAFSDMLQRIKTAAEKELYLQKEQERMKYEALQKQIAPHFIHNTLYVISIAAQEKRNDDVIVMCKGLSDILRYSMNLEHMKVRFEEELAYIKNYIRLQEENYGEDFHYTIEVDERWMNVEIPRMFLQPFVENCFKHGFGNAEPPYCLKICGTADNDSYQLYIEDNGAGITDGALLHIEDMLENPDYNKTDSEDSLGVVNTIRRFRYLYGDKGNVTVERRLQGGTRVKVEIRRR